MDSKELKTFLESLKTTDIEELCWEAGESKLYFKRDEVPQAAAPKAAVKESVKPKEEKKFMPVKSPMVGTFFYSDSSDRPPFVMVGNHVVPGQKVGVIEAMKIMKEVDSTIKGKIVKILVNSGQPVEYGQELFLIDTEDDKGTEN